MQSYKAYLDFIKFSIGSHPSVPDSMEGINWADFYDFCLRQGIAGLVLDGLERSGLKIPQDILFEWIGTVEAIKATNHIIDKRCRHVSLFWEKEGFRSCILKGQANAMMYPKPELRSSGDIDIWVDGYTKNRNNTERTAEIIRIALRETPDGHYSLHHVTMPVFNDTSVEVHYRPVFLDNWWKDRRLQKYIDEVKDTQFENRIVLNDGKTEICGLRDDFNAVFLMLHMWHHLLSTRNNLKQLIDYYFLLKRGFSLELRNDIANRFKVFGVYRYAQGIMWIEYAILGLDKQNLLVDPDEKIGRVLLEETIQYGQKRVQHGKVGKLISRVTRNTHLFSLFPSPVLIAPVYLLWHQWWKKKMKYKLKYHFGES